MSDVVIRAEGLGKKYVIGHEAEGERDNTLRDVIARQARRFVRSAADMARGRALVVGETREDFWALRDVNFEIRRGEVVGIIGRNGAGKSTLLKILSRITETTEGRVTIDGRVASLLEVGTGFHPELTGRENIFLNGAILGMTRAEIRRKFDEIVAFAGVEKFIDTPVKRYSSGMKVRLGFSVAAHLEPEILVVDEVLAVGDAEFQKKCLGKMQDVAGQGRTVLFVSHNLTAVSRLCTKGFLLHAGRMAYSGETEFVISEYFGDVLRNEIVDTSTQIKDLPYDDNVELFSVSVTQEGQNRDIFSAAMPIEIAIDWKIKVSHPGLRVYFDLLGDQDQLIIRSFFDDLDHGLGRQPPGLYRSITRIPRHTLSIAKYFIVIRITIHQLRACTGKGVRIPIDIGERGLYNSAFPGDVDRALLGVHLGWSTHRVEAAPCQAD